MPTFGQTLKALREKAGLSQRALATETGASQKSISGWEADTSEPSLSNLKKLCASLDVTCDVFFAADTVKAVRKSKRK
jgi:transcriptional regulator with XRE-family HTH domain